MQARGVPVPPHIATAPDLSDGHMLYWHAYLDLLSCRAPGSRLIPWDSLDRYARRAPDPAMLAFVVRATERAVFEAAGND